jgi:hypothetical protein
VRANTLQRVLVISYIVEGNCMGARFALSCAVLERLQVCITSARTGRSWPGHHGVGLGTRMLASWTCLSAVQEGVC